MAQPNAPTHPLFKHLVDDGIHDVQTPMADEVLEAKVFVPILSNPKPGRREFKTSIVSFQGKDVAVFDAYLDAQLARKKSRGRLYEDVPRKMTVRELIDLVANDMYSGIDLYYWRNGQENVTTFNYDYLAKYDDFIRDGVPAADTYLDFIRKLRDDEVHSGENQEQVLTHEQQNKIREAIEEHNLGLIIDIYEIDRVLNGRTVVVDLTPAREISTSEMRNLQGSLRKLDAELGTKIFALMVQPDSMHHGSLGQSSHTQNDSFAL